MSRERVVAVVVAYNRRDLLRETLDALAAQVRRADVVIVIDNASSDDSATLARRHPIGAKVITLPRNTGGAGGFSAGIARALSEEQADLVWLMDDDTIPTPRALAEMLDARASYAGRVAAVASRVVWHDGRDHPMNTPRARLLTNREQDAKAAAVGAVPIRTASFVSLLLDAGAIRREGLPEADYFIWNDDFEYSARILRHRVGLFVASSVVEHRTKTFGASDVDPGERFYYEVRNKIWMLRFSRAFGAAEGMLYAGSSLRRWVRTYRASADRAVLRRTGLAGLRAALAAPPRPPSVVLADMGATSEAVDAVTARQAPTARRGRVAGGWR